MTEAGSSHSFPSSSQQLSLFLLGVFVEGSYGRRPLQLVFENTGHWSALESLKGSPGDLCEALEQAVSFKVIPTSAKTSRPFVMYFLLSCPLHRPPTSSLALCSSMAYSCSSPTFLSGATSPGTLPPSRFYKKLLSFLRVFLNTGPIYTVPSSPPLAPQSCPVVYSS